MSVKQTKNDFVVRLNHKTLDSYTKTQLVCYLRKLAKNQNKLNELTRTQRG